jgi:tetratricopeptide (TPR) repeat protein
MNLFVNNTKQNLTYLQDGYFFTFKRSNYNSNDFTINKIEYYDKLHNTSCNIYPMDVDNDELERIIILYKNQNFSESIRCLDTFINQFFYNSSTNGIFSINLSLCRQINTILETIIKNYSITPQILSRRGFVLFLLGRYDDALKSFKNSYSMDDSDVFCLLNFGFVLLKLNQFDEGVLYFDKILESDPNHHQALLGKGICLEALGKHNEATKYYSSMLNISEKNSNFFRNIGFSLILLGKNNDAINYFNRALEITPDDPSITSGKNSLTDYSPDDILTMHKTHDENIGKMNSMINDIDFLQKTNLKNQKLIRELSEKLK